EAIVLLGPAGSGQRAKIVNNALLSANAALAFAGLGVGEALGIDRKALAEVVGVSSGRSLGLTIAANLPPPEDFFGGRLLLKDIDLLRAILPDDPHAAELDRAARGFLLAATGQAE